MDLSPRPGPGARRDHPVGGFEGCLAGGDLLLPRLILGDESTAFHSALHQQLGNHFEISGVATDAEALVELARDHRPDAALVEVVIDGGGLRATEGICDVSPETAVVILSVDDHRASVLMLLQAGAVCYLRKGIEHGLLAEQVHRAIAARRASFGGELLS
jgi:two-component system, NarL family, response regulator LiaR